VHHGAHSVYGYVHQHQKKSRKFFFSIFSYINIRRLCTCTLQDPLENQHQKSTPFKLVACLALVGHPKGAQLFFRDFFRKDNKKKGYKNIKCI
jgi:hypothetical protein